VHNASVLLKDIASLGTVGDLAAIAGQLIGQCLITQKEADLISIFTTLSTNQGTTATSTNLAPADLYDAYGSLRGSYAPLPYNLVMGADLIWSSVGLISLFDNSADAVQTQGLGTVGEDWARNGYAGMALGFSIFADGNITADASYISDGIAFSKAVAKNVIKRGFQIEVDRDITEVGTEIVGTDIRGEAILRQKHGNLMSFATT